MPIRPFDLEQNNPIIEIPDEIHRVLVDTGLESKPIDNSNKKEIRAIFNGAGASVYEAAKQISNIMARGETDNGRLKAAELTLRVHEVLKAIDETAAPQITININGSENKTLVNLVLPVV